ncbi:hypothetical protein [Pontibacter sp. G13]|uniref:hypothetical protein n=1 Tax=Pontibacter sp. G13 TaxID=3074898 RepID=UPI00288C1065|nr:hypothetical protein [Pontibacter sp. G13]WNJ17563.1 hypothetical protein RJD25_22160 [Pontibacter sp. G13]
MISQPEQSDALNRILDSQTFGKATTTRTLLAYLVSATIERQEISAASIGLELFGKKYDPAKHDVNIRVNISHLRKRLKRYYDQEGGADPIRISIEPGQYYASFAAKSVPQNSVKGLAWGGMIAVALILIGALGWSFSGPDDRMWTPMFENELETTLYLGDVFGYSGPTQFGSMGWHRDSKINSSEEFYNRVKQSPEKHQSLRPAAYTYVVFENAFNIKPFTQYFTQQEYQFSVRQTSDFSGRSLKDRNTIYAGPFFVQSAFNDIFNDFSKNVQLHFDTTSRGPVILQYTEDGLPKRVNITSKFGDEEYALASAFNGPNGTRHYLFFSNHGMGLTAVVEHFTNPEALEVFSAEYLAEGEEFVALFHVKGKDRTSMSMELVLWDGNR